MSDRMIRLVAQAGPLPFPAGLCGPEGSRPFGRNGDAAANALNALDDVSRRMEDLARELNCLGYFHDDDDDRPRAA